MSTIHLIIEHGTWKGASPANTPADLEAALRRLIPADAFDALPDPIPTAEESVSYLLGQVASLLKENRALRLQLAQQAH